MTSDRCTPARTQSRWPSWLTWVLVLFVLAWIPRLIWALKTHRPPFSDMEDYYLCAINLSKGLFLAQSEDRLAYRAPLYPLFLYVCINLSSGNALSVIRLVQSVIGAASFALLFLFSIEVFKPLAQHCGSFFKRWPYLIPFLLSLYAASFTSHIFFSSLIMTETLYVFLLMLWANVGIRCTHEKHFWRLMLFSFLLGVMALTRPVSLFFVPVVIYKTCACFPRSLWFKRLWGPSVAWLLPIIPWTIRNMLMLGAFVLISTNSGVNLFLGHNPEFGYYATGLKEQVRQHSFKEYGSDEVAEDHLFWAVGMNHIKQDPLAVISRSQEKFHYLYFSEYLPWPWEEYLWRAEKTLPGVPWVFLWWNNWLFALAIIGIIYARYRRLPDGIALSVIGIYTLSCMIFFARTRFRIPLEPFLVMYAALGFLPLVELFIWGYRGLFSRNTEHSIEKDTYYDINSS